MPGAVLVLGHRCPIQVPDAARGASQCELELSGEDLSSLSPGKGYLLVSWSSFGAAIVMRRTLGRSDLRMNDEKGALVKQIIPRG